MSMRQDLKLQEVIRSLFFSMVFKLYMIYGYVSVMVIMDTIRDTTISSVSCADSRSVCILSEIRFDWVMTVRKGVRGECQATFLPSSCCHTQWLLYHELPLVPLVVWMQNKTNSRGRVLHVLRLFWSFEASVGGYKGISASSIEAALYNCQICILVSLKWNSCSSMLIQRWQNLMFTTEV